MIVMMSFDVKHFDNVNDIDYVVVYGYENVFLLTRFYSPVFYRGDKSKRPPPPPAAANPKRNNLTNKKIFDIIIL